MEGQIRLLFNASKRQMRLVRERKIEGNARVDGSKSMMSTDDVIINGS